jgi:hypothetical protein
MKIRRVEVAMTHENKQADRYNEATRNKQDRRVPMPSDVLETAISAFDLCLRLQGPPGSTPPFMELHNF